MSSLFTDAEDTTMIEEGMAPGGELAGFIYDFDREYMYFYGRSSEAEVAKGSDYSVYRKRYVGKPYISLCTHVYLSIYAYLSWRSSLPLRQKPRVTLANETRSFCSSGSSNAYSFSYSLDAHLRTESIHRGERRGERERKQGEKRWKEYELCSPLQPH